MRYCIWNNKGGVGKSFLTFCLATEYAIKNKDEIVVVADMCPQANVSEMLLGGNGKGQENLSKVNESGHTIAEYIKERFLKRSYGKLGTELLYFKRASDYNPNISPNLFLLPGDINLDLASTLISILEKDPIKEAPTRAMSMLLDLLTTYEDAYKNKKITCFIDCNPSFAIYTELAVFASDRLIVPCTGDFASLRGVNNVMKILYNIGKEDEKDSMFNIINFNEKASNLKLRLPELYMGIINKARTHDKKSTAAYKAHVKEIESCFEKLQNPTSIVEVKDCNNISLVANYTGTPISKLEQKTYVVYGKRTQLAESQLAPMRENIDLVLRKIV